MTTTKPYLLGLMLALGLGACGDALSPEPQTLAPDHPTFAAYTAPAGMIKPVAAVRDYNGTFDGEIVSGALDYTTLYRDRYGNYTGKGEGSGRHGGVDIRVNAGTTVRASLGGRVVRARCNWNGMRDNTKTGWGGWVVIKSRNPYSTNPSDSVLFTYAHLDKWDYVSEGPNVYVTTGQVIGLSGGSPTSGICPGNSSGPHLHFQIDKDFPNDFDPVFADLSGSENPDTYFAVSQKTFNPMAFIQGGYRWEFQTDNNGEYWVPGNTRSSGISGGAYWMDGNFDPWLRRGDGNVSCGRTYLCSSQITAEGDLYRYVRIDMHLNCAVTPLTVYFTTDASSQWDQTKSVDVPVGYGAASITIPMWDRNASWRGRIITGLRVDPSVNCDWGNEVNYIGNIRLVSSSTG